jgi:signal transduction histidine kinase
MIVSEVDRLHLTLQRVLDFARLPEEANVHSEPDRIIARMVSIMEYYALQRGVILGFELGASHVTVAGNEQTLNEVFMNLVKNAIEACSERPNAKVTIVTSADADSYHASVIDNGPGIAPIDQNLIFDAFVTYKETGTGLGLYIVRERIQELGGTIALHSVPNHGATFTVVLPRSAK